MTNLRARVRRLLDRFVASLARIVLGVFFRDVTVIGAQRIPRGAPLVLVANHPNGLIDPLLIIAFLPLRTRMLGRNTLWANVALRPLLALAGTVPVYRRTDAAADMWRNTDTFARCHEVLAAGGAVSIFPEGHSHSEPDLLPLRTGAARIVLEAEAKHPDLGVRILPVAVAYDAKDRFRSRARVYVGEPIDPAPEIARCTDDPIAAVRALTTRIRRRLRALATHASRGARRPPRPRHQDSPAMWLLPIAAAGLALNWMACELTRRFAARVTNRLEMRATYTILAGFYLLPAFWLLEAAAAGWAAGPGGALAVVLAAPAGAWVALRVRDRHGCPGANPRRHDAEACISVRAA